ncbi:MAG: nucleotidyltransferase domain-containing protein [Segetibacter sp.]
MLDKAEILSKIKSLVKEEIPDAKVYLFGSRATGKVHEESDWDVLILTSEKVDRSLKHKLHDTLFPLSVEICSFIDFIVVNKNDWEENPSYYSLSLSIENEVLAI